MLEAALDPGESAAISLALELDAARILLDDLPARLLAERLGLTVMGTLGALVLAKQRGLIPAVRPLLDALRSTNFYMSDRLYWRLLRAADED